MNSSVMTPQRPPRRRLGPESGDGACRNRAITGDAAGLRTLTVRSERVSARKHLVRSAVNRIDRVGEVDEFVHERLPDAGQADNNADADNRDQQDVLDENRALPAVFLTLNLFFQSAKHGLYLSWCITLSDLVAFESRRFRALIRPARVPAMPRMSTASRRTVHVCSWTPGFEPLS